MGEDKERAKENDVSCPKLLPICRVTFRVQLNACKGDGVRVVGSCPELGDWNPSQGVNLVTQHGYAYWYTPGGVHLPIQKRVDYKYVLLDRDGKFKNWEDFPTGNRTLVPTGLSMIIEDDYGVGRKLNSSVLLLDCISSSSETVLTSSNPEQDSSTAPKYSNQLLSELPKLSQKCDKSDDVIAQNLLRVNSLGTTLLIISFLLPLKVVKDPGSASFTLEKQKLLVMPQLHALRDALQYPVKFFGWPGVMTQNEEEEKEIEKLLEPQNCVPVFFDSEIHLKFSKFVDECLWPFFHNVSTLDSQTLDKLTLDGWNEYKSLNSRYAKRVHQHYKETDLIWVHDFHLLLVPKYIAEIAQSFSRPSVGIFLHTPFPDFDIFRYLPMREEILKGILEADVVGFHFFEYARHFLVANKRLLNIDHHFRMGGFLELDYTGRNIVLRIGHVHLQYDELYKSIYSSETVEIKVQELRKLYKGKYVFASIDRCDWLSGIELKFQGFENLLHHYLDARKRAILIQLAYVSGDAQKPELLQYRQTIEKMAHKINSKFSDSSYILGPVVLSIQSVSHEDKYALYAASSCFLDTSIRNGLNLTPFEYICCRESSPAPLILSEFTGCCHTLASALRVNPWKVDDITQALDRAMTMPQEELSDRLLRDKMYIQRNSTIQWANEFLADLQQSRRKDHLLYVTPGFGSLPKVLGMDSEFKYLEKREILKAFCRTKRRVFFFDHEGTLAPDRRRITTVPGFESLSATGAAPSALVKKCLSTLCQSDSNVVVILSGRDCHLLSRWFEDIPNIGLCAEHGYYYKVPLLKNERWKCVLSNPHVDLTWKGVTMELIRHYVKRTQGSFIENKGSALVFQYRDADPDFGSWQAKELSQVLEELLSESPVTVMSGKGYVEVKLQNVNKGNAVDKLLKKLDALEPIDFALCIGDDRSDEDMFSVVNAFFCPEILKKTDSNQENTALINKGLPLSFTVTVGKKPSSARYFLNCVEDVSALLEAFTENIKN